MTGVPAFCCPRCRDPLQPVKGLLTCAGCGAEYQVRDGIYDFRCRRHDYYFNPVPRERMRELVQQATAVEWDETVRGFLRHVRNVPDWIDNVAVNGRYAWKLFLELAPGSRFLDFGCGLGNLTRNIAPHGAEVVALDLTWERLMFAQQRFARFNPGQPITLVAGGDSAHLPFPDAHFDGIALSGVLEWIPADPALDASRGSRLGTALHMLMTLFGESNPRRTQLRFLKELRRILRPDGQLFVAIENRWGYEYFQGRPDHHSSLNYASLLPRFAANVYSIARRRKPYRTYTHTLGGLRRLFKAAGFPEQTCLGLTPGYSGLEEIIPLDTDEAFWKPAAAPDLKGRVTRSRLFVPAFGMVGHANGRKPSLLDRVLNDIRAGVPGLADIALHTCLISGKEKVVFTGTAGGQDVILKIPVESGAEAGETNAAEVVAMLAGDPQLAGLLPLPLARGSLQGVVYFVEKAVPGRPLAESWSPSTRAASARMVESVLRRLNRSVSRPEPFDSASPAHSALIAEPLSRIAASGLDRAECERLNRSLAVHLSAFAWRPGLAHGDFSRHNIFVSGNEVSGLIDWEYATERGIPALDAVAYMNSVQRLADHRSGRRLRTGENMVRLARWEWPCDEELQMLRNIYRYFEIDPAVHGVLCQLCWLHHVDHQLQTARRFDPHFMPEHVLPVLAYWTSQT